MIGVVPGKKRVVSGQESLDCLTGLLQKSFLAVAWAVDCVGVLVGAATAAVAVCAVETAARVSKDAATANPSRRRLLPVRLRANADIGWLLVVGGSHYLMMFMTYSLEAQLGIRLMSNWCEAM